MRWIAVVVVTLLLVGCAHRTKGRRHLLALVQNAAEIEMPEAPAAPSTASR
jgi:hypothetical protein